VVRKPGLANVSFVLSKATSCWVDFTAAFEYGASARRSASWRVR
jgi:hypothetical protein